MINGEEVARLIIYGVTPDDAGAYSISVSNTYGLASEVINVSIVGKKRTLIQFDHFVPVSALHIILEIIQILLGIIQF